MSKHYAVQNFDIGNNTIHCFTTWTRNGFCHHAEYYDENFNFLAKRRVSYINRTWERFEYEECLKELAAKLPKARRIELEAFIQVHARKVREECEAFVNRFATAMKQLSPTQKDTLAKAVGHIESEEQANAAMMMATTMALV